MAFPFDPEQPVPDPLTPEAAARVLDERRQSLPAWIQASRDAVVYLGELSRWDPPETLLENPSHGLTHMSTICGVEDLTAFRMIGYDPFDLLLTTYCAEYMFSDVGGTWVLDEDPESPTFGRFLIGAFDTARPEATVDVYAAVTAFLEEPEGRDLERLLESLQEAMGAPVGVTDTSFP
ncbi:hypothetical protein HNR12_003492 [Streptomonospora nanhaiensis]|uniref:Uncharacterized protein n=1 Tax=Streptomonospora nanhaiensis TaxID=1323731 RepID=A0A853BR51_9ACTN|nr:hypothetical protein [Streptomonospora nanhaiensis]NYI97215.1 hypothetical protein [Streptomonospora nanhaiensis]